MSVTITLDRPFGNIDSVAQYISSQPGLLQVGAALGSLQAQINQLTTGAQSNLVNINAVAEAAQESADDPITAEDFVAGIEPVHIVTSLPVLPNASFPISSVVVLTSDGKLYRNVANVWTAVVPATDITGQITNTQITDGAISTPKLAAGSVITSKLAAGAVTANELAANSIIAGKIATGAISAAAAVFQAAAIQSADINTLSVAKLTAGTINLSGSGAIIFQGYGAGGGLFFESTAGTTDIDVLSTGLHVRAARAAQWFDASTLLGAQIDSRTIQVIDTAGNLALGMIGTATAHFRAAGTAYYDADSTSGGYKFNNIQVVGAQQADIGVPSFTVLGDAQTYCASLRTVLRNHGLMA